MRTGDWIYGQLKEALGLPEVTEQGILFSSGRQMHRNKRERREEVKKGNL